MQHIGKKIRTLIDESKYSAKEIAEIIGTSFQNIYRLFEKESVETKHLFLIAEALGIPITQFFEEESRDNLTKEISTLKEEVRSNSETIAQLQTQIDLYKKLLEVSEDKFKKRVESNIFLSNLFETASEQLQSDPNFNTSAFLYKYAQSMLEQGEVNGIDLVYKLRENSDLTRLIDMTLKKVQRSS